MNCLDSTNLLSTERLYSNLNINLFNCFFVRTTIYLGAGGAYQYPTSNYGGVIYCWESNFEMNLKHCVFYNISCGMSGGAIFFYCLSSPLSQININFTCAFECKCVNNQNGCFGYLAIKEKSMNLSFISISQCSKDGIGRTPLFIYQGYMNLNSINSSNNKCQADSGICIYYPKKLELNFSTFSNNIVHSDNSCIYLLGGSNSNEFNYINIIKNNSPFGKSIVYLTSNTNININNSVFYNNQNMLLFGENGCSINLYNCIIQHLAQLGNGNYISNNLFFTNNITINTLQLFHFGTHNCQNDNLKIDFSSPKNIFDLKIIHILLIFSLSSK